MEASLVAQSVRNLPEVQETRVRSLGQEDLLVKEMANHSSVLAWKIPWIEKPGRLKSMGWQTIRLSFFHPRQSYFYQCTRFPQD